MHVTRSRQVATPDAKRVVASYIKVPGGLWGLRSFLHFR